MIGNKTVSEILTNEVDIRSEKLKLSKFMSEYDLKDLPVELLNHNHLTLKELASFVDILPEIPYSILEDDVPKIKARHYSITNDPYFDKEKGIEVDKAHNFKICLTVHTFKLKEQDEMGLSSQFLKNLIDKKDYETKFRCSFT